MISLSSAWTNNRPVRTVLRWQAVLTGIAAIAAACLGGVHAAVSAVLGGTISMAAGLLFAAIAVERRGRSADSVLMTAFKAEGAKIAFIVAALWLALAAYKNVVATVLIGAFIPTVLVSSLALFVGNRQH
ncbi:MAG TPA: ATP synthase subunit I [Burkholderiales bacterium]|nr:ATP synthase subunit I [Burkholderiales bacterium]